MLKVKNEGKNTLKSVVEIFLLAKRVEGCRKGTLEQYGFVFKPLFESLGEVSLSEITVHHIRQHLTFLEEKKLSKVTFYHHIARLKTFFEFLLREKFITSNPIELIRKPKLPKQFPYILQEKKFKKGFEQFSVED